MIDRKKVIKKAERIMCSTVDRDMIDSFCEDVLELLKEQENANDTLSEESVMEREEIYRITNSGKVIPNGELIRCKDCKNWIPGTITDQDDFIPPKCGKYQQMVGHSNDDYCSLAEKKAT